MRDNEKYASIVDMSNNDIQFKDKLRDCYLKISDLEAKLAESEKEVEFLKEENKINKKDADYYFDEYRLYKRQLAEKENSVVLKPDKYVIVTNGWKKQGYGIAKVHQEVRDVYYYCSNNRIGSFSPMTQYGEFETLEEAEAKLKELKKK